MATQAHTTNSLPVANAITQTDMSSYDKLVWVSTSQNTFHKSLTDQLADKQGEFWRVDARWAQPVTGSRFTLFADSGQRAWIRLWEFD